MNTYYANVTFPNSALELPALRQLYRKLPPEYVLEQDYTVTIADPEAEFGSLAITDMLDALQVPYDHFHRNEAARNVYTQQIRFEGGVRVMRIVRDADVVLKRYAQELLELLQAGSIEQVMSQLEYTANKTSLPEITAVAQEWSPHDMYVLFNAQAFMENEGGGYWSDDLGWTHIQEAKLFTPVEKAVYEPDDNTVWKTLAEAFEGVSLRSVQ